MDLYRGVTLMEMMFYLITGHGAGLASVSVCGDLSIRSRSCDMMEYVMGKEDIFSFWGDL